MRNLFSIVVIIIIFSSCHTQKMMADTQDSLQKLKNEQQTENAKLNAVDSIANAKFEQGKIDKNVRGLIKNILSKRQRAMDSARIEMASIDSLLANKRAFRNNYITNVKPSIDSLRKRVAFNEAKSSLYVMVEDALNIADYKLFDLAAFFGPGIYVIPDDKKDIVIQSFAPILDSLILFSNKYNQIPSTATLIVLGYADGAGFASEGLLVDTLKLLLAKESPTKEELNQKLSELRAKELSNEFKLMFATKESSFINLSNLRITYINQGKGEEYPLPNIKDYKIEDDRRRIVLCYWAVLPD